MRALFLTTACLLACSLAFAATTTVTVNGKTVTVPVIEAKGKAYIDVVALMKLLGGQATFSPAKHAVAISTTAPKPPSGSSTSSGTAQLPGENGQFETIYTLRKDTPLYFSLKSAEYTLMPVIIGENLYYARADEKILVLRFTVQNPNKTETFVRWDSLKFTAVDAMNVNHEGVGDWGDAESKQSFSMTMKPAQKIELYTAIVVPAKGQVPKLMVMSTNEGDPVLRYDLRGKVTGLKAPVADLADATGATALDTIPVALNTPFALQYHTLTVESIAYSIAALGEYTPDEGQRFCIVTLSMKNTAPTQQFTRWDSFQMTLTTADGDTGEYKTMLLATAPRDYSQEMKSGQEARVRLLFSLPADAVGKTLRIKEGESHEFELTVK